VIGNFASSSAYIGLKQSHKKIRDQYRTDITLTDAYRFHLLLVLLIGEEVLILTTFSAKEVLKDSVNRLTLWVLGVIIKESNELLEDVCVLELPILKRRQCLERHTTTCENPISEITRGKKKKNERKILSRDILLCKTCVRPLTSVAPILGWCTSTLSVRGARARAAAVCSAFTVRRCCFLGRAASDDAQELAGDSGGSIRSKVR
jgi:hypothetical protein